MQDTFQWTDDLAFEFASRYPLLTVANKKAIIEAFKANNSPKKEWEIVAYSFEPLKGIDKPVLVTQGSKYWWSAISGDKDFLIHSVRRLSDQVIFTKNEVVGTPSDGQHHIGGFEIRGNAMYAQFSVGQISIEHLQKLPQPILTTVDGVGIFEMEHFWCLKHGFPDMLNPYTACEQTPEWFAAEKGYQIFSTKDAMNNWLAENKPLLSLNDVKNYVKAGESASFAIEKLTALVKQKLNQ